MFRKLRADEVECRISICNEYGVGILLYKDARCDQNILDETVGPMNWQRHHTRDNANCIVSIWDEEKSRWIEKEDTGTESFTEKEKGLASDSFKRACFNWGIGRELYTAPNMFVGSANLYKHEKKDGKWTCKDSFKVCQIDYHDGSIRSVRIASNKTNKAFVFGEPLNPTPNTQEDVNKSQQVAKQKIDRVKIDALCERCVNEGVSEDTLLKLYKVQRLEDLTERQYAHINEHWDKLKGSKSDVPANTPSEQLPFK